MLWKKSVLVVAVLLLLTLTFAAPAAQANKSGDIDAIVHHLQTRYQAKKVHIPFMWMARAAVHVVRPAGVKSLNITLFDGLRFSRDTLDLEMQNVMKRSFSAEWSSIFHVRSREGQQAYMYMREDGQNVKITLVT